MIEIYTDGSCIGNPGPGGAAFAIIKNGEVEKIKSFSFRHTTNNFAELYAVLACLGYIIENNIIECRIFSDSKYAVDGISTWMHKWETNGWVGSNKKQICNLGLWQDVNMLWYQASSMCNLSIIYVKGHSKNRWNDLVDKEAKNAGIRIQ